MKTEILKLLRESKDYVSGQQICEKFQVSRTAVWKVIKQLQEEGYQIEAVRNKGYRLVSLPDILSREEILSQMETCWAGQEVHYFAETDSTNIRAKQLGEAGRLTELLWRRENKVQEKAGGEDPGSLLQTGTFICPCCSDRRFCL